MRSAPHGTLKVGRGGGAGGVSVLAYVGCIRDSALNTSARVARKSCRLLAGSSSSLGLLCAVAGVSTANAVPNAGAIGVLLAGGAVLVWDTLVCGR